MSVFPFEVRSLWNFFGMPVSVRVRSRDFSVLVPLGSNLFLAFHVIVVAMESKPRDTLHLLNSFYVLLLPVP